MPDRHRRATVTERAQTRQRGDLHCQQAVGRHVGRIAEAEMRRRELQHIVFRHADAAVAAERSFVQVAHRHCHRLQHACADTVAGPDLHRIHVVAIRVRRRVEIRRNREQQPVAAVDREMRPVGSASNRECHQLQFGVGRGQCAHQGRTLEGAARCRGCDGRRGVGGRTAKHGQAVDIQCRRVAGRSQPDVGTLEQQLARRSRGATGATDRERDDVEAPDRDAGIGVDGGAVDRHQQRAGRQRGAVERGGHGQQVQAHDLVAPWRQPEGGSIQQQTAVSRCGGGAGAGSSERVDVVVQRGVGMRHDKGTGSQQRASDHGVRLHQRDGMDVVGGCAHMHTVVEQQEVLAAGVVSRRSGAVDDDVLAVDHQRATIQCHGRRRPARVQHHQEIARIECELRVAGGPDGDRRLHIMHAADRHRRGVAGQQRDRAAGAAGIDVEAVAGVAELRDLPGSPARATGADHRACGAEPELPGRRACGSDVDAERALHRVEVDAANGHATAVAHLESEAGVVVAAGTRRRCKDQVAGI